MAAPTPTVRSTPSGIKLRDGFGGLITLAIDPDIEFWEITVKPPALMGGDPIKSTTNHNDNVHTKRPRTIQDRGNIQATVAYDPKCMASAKAAINVETTVTKTWPDGSTLAAYGYLKDFDPQNMQEGELPTANIEIVLTNWDPVNHVEADYVYTDVAGT
jgi:hypothetical protein